MQLSITGKALRTAMYWFSLVHFIFSKMQAVAMMRKEHHRPLQGWATDSASSTAAKLDMTAVRLLEVRTEANSYSLSKEPMFELSKNTSNSSPTEQNHTRTIRNAKHNYWGFQQNQAHIAMYVQRDASWWGTPGNLEQHGGYGEKKNVAESSQTLVCYLPHDKASK